MKSCRKNGITVRIGTMSLLFGAHQFAIHPWFVAWAWWRLYGFPFDPRLWIAFVIHDWGYWASPNMDGPEGERHVELGASIMHWLFDRPRYYRWRTPSGVLKREPQYRWLHFCLFHSRYYAKLVGQPFSRLCVADKLALALTPAWLYLPLARLTGELTEYTTGPEARTPTGERDAQQWYRDAQRYCEAWALTHVDCRPDTWTGTTRDLAINPKGVGVLDSSKEPQCTNSSKSRN